MATGSPPRTLTWAPRPLTNMVTRARVDSGQQGRGCGDVAADTCGAVGGAQRGCGSARSWDPPPGQEPLGWPQRQRMRPKDVTLSRWPWGAPGTGRKHAGRPGGCGSADHGPHSGLVLVGEGGAGQRAGREAGVQGQPRVLEPTHPLWLCHPRTPVCGPHGLMHTWAPVERGFSESGHSQTRGLSQPLLPQHSRAQHRVPTSCLLGLQPWGAGLGPPPSSCGAFPRLKAPQPLTGVPRPWPCALPAQLRLTTRVARPRADGTPRGAVGDGMARVMSRAIPGDLREPCTTSQRHEKEGEGETDVVSCKHADFSM